MLLLNFSNELTLISWVRISPSEATSWCVNTYLSHLDSAFSLGADTLMAFGMMGCSTVPRSRLEEGLWSTHFSAPAERDRRCRGRTGVDVWFEHMETLKRNVKREIIIQLGDTVHYETSRTCFNCVTKHEYLRSPKLCGIRNKATRTSSWMAINRSTFHDTFFVYHNQGDTTQ